jgi:hypothetical protein
VTQHRLYSLLPAWYRGQDAAARGAGAARAPIEAFVARVEAGFEALHGAIHSSYDNWFVETCAPELLPVLGTLVGLELTGPPLPGDRRLVADALARWAGKGSEWALRDALEAACGWPVEIREFEKTLLASRATRHPRLEQRDGRGDVLGAGTTVGPNLRRIDVRVRRGFRVVVEDADPFDAGNGWYTFDPGGLLQRCERRSVRVHAAGEDIALERPSAEQLRAWEGAPELEPEGGVPLLDARRGRFWLPAPAPDRLRVDRVSVRPGPIGAGLPDADVTPPAGAWRALVSRDFSREEHQPSAGRYHSIEEALADWPRGHDADVRVLDSGSYGRVSTAAPPGQSLTLHAHPGEMPHLESVDVTGRLVLSGMLVTGDVRVSADAELRSCTLRGACSIGGGSIRRSVVGPVEVRALGQHGLGELRVFDSVVGHAGPDEAEAPSITATGEGLTLLAERSTFLGTVSVSAVTRARDCLFAAAVWVARPYPGRFEHSPYPVGSRTGDANDEHAFDAGDAPRFASRLPEAPGYARLLGPDALIRAATDGGEPGAFHSVHAAARLARLDQMLARFLPAGFTASVEIINESNDG